MTGFVNWDFAVRKAKIMKIMRILRHTKYRLNDNIGFYKKEKRQSLFLDFAFENQIDFYCLLGFSFKQRVLVFAKTTAWSPK